MKNIIKKILVGSVSLIIIIIIISAVIIIKNKSLEAEKNIETTTNRIIADQDIAEETISEVEEMTEIESNESVEEVIQEEPVIETQSKSTEEVKQKESTNIKTQSQNTKQNNKVSENPSTTASVIVQTNNNDNTNKPKENNAKPNPQENKNTGNNNPTPNTIPETNNSNNANQTPSNQKVETYKYNSQMAQKMITVITSNESEYMKQYGYSVAVDESIVANTNQFTFTESRVKNAVTYKFGTIRVYARDYYVNGQYMWTECFII